MSFRSSCAKGCGRGRRRSCIAATSAMRGRIPPIQACRCRKGSSIPPPAAATRRSPSRDAASTRRRRRAASSPADRSHRRSRSSTAWCRRRGRRKPIFDGIDTTVPGLARLAGLPEGAIRAELAAMDAAAKKALADYEPLEPARIIPALADGLRATRAARAAVKSAGGTADARADADFLLAFKETEFTDALVRAAEVDVDPLASLGDGGAGRYRRRSRSHLRAAWSHGGSPESHRQRAGRLEDRTCARRHGRSERRRVRPARDADQRGVLPTARAGGCAAHAAVLSETAPDRRYLQVDGRRSEGAAVRSAADHGVGRAHDRRR